MVVVEEVGAEIKHADLDRDNDHLNEEVLNNGKGILDPDILVDILARVDLDLAYTSEKLGNVDLYMTDVSLLESEIGALSMVKGDISAEESEQALIFDLSLTYLHSEVRELQFLLNNLQAQVLAVQQNILSCENLGELFGTLQAKLYSSESSLKQSQEQLVEINEQLGKLRSTLLMVEPENSHMLSDENSEDVKLKLQCPKQQKVVLRLLEKSIAQELDLEKKLSESKENEEHLKSKLCLAEQVVSSVEAETEVAWERMLDAENAAEAFKGVAKEMLCRLQIVQFSLNGSLLREEELKFKLQNCLNQLTAQSADTNEGSEEGHEMHALKEKVVMLEEKLKESELRLKRANIINESSREQLSEMEHKIEMLRESAFVAESRAGDAEAKLAALTETNVELTEELGFLKGGADSNNEKISLLEKQVRELENQLQHAKASSEASQEQQNMLYSAIWDMETLIEDLKSRVSKAETKAENAEEQCLILAENNLKLNKEISDLKCRTESLQGSLMEVDRMKIARAKEIDTGATLITDMVMRLAIERERIHKQLNSLVRQNKILTEELRGSKKKASETKPGDKEDVEKQVEEPTCNSAMTTHAEASIDELTKPTSTSNKADEASKDTKESENEIGSFQLDEDAAGNLLKHEAASKERGCYLRATHILLAFVFVLSALALHLFQEDILSTFRHYLGQQ
ncbi:hypothetical protein Ancab_018653 [Ancistrocladus abbreviatus]